MHDFSGSHEKNRLHLFTHHLLTRAIYFQTRWAVLVFTKEQGFTFTYLDCFIYGCHVVKARIWPRILGDNML